MSNYDFYLWKFSQVDSGFVFKHVSELPKAGFASLYGVTQADAEALQVAGSYAGFRGTVHAPLLAVDADGEKESAQVESALRGLGLGFQKWSTGNRGNHFTLTRLAEPSHRLPEMDKSWVAENVPGADMRLYTHLHLFRQPGARHEKTGKLKTLIETVSGSPLVLNFEPAIKEIAPTRIEGGYSVFEDSRILSLSVPHHNGERHQNLCRLAKLLVLAGQPYDFCFVWLQNVNDLCTPEPKPESELKRMLDWAFETVGGSK